jgi:hypothetical protein
LFRGLIRHHQWIPLVSSLRNSMLERKMNKRKGLKFNVWHPQLTVGVSALSAIRWWTYTHGVECRVSPEILFASVWYFFFCSKYIVHYGEMTRQLRFKHLDTINGGTLGCNSNDRSGRQEDGFVLVGLCIFNNVITTFFCIFGRCTLYTRSENASFFFFISPAWLKLWNLSVQLGRVFLTSLGHCGGFISFNHINLFSINLVKLKKFDHDSHSDK